MTNKNTTTELKPCPFCGGKAQLLEAMGEAWYICTECKSSCGLSTGSVNRAIAAWNRRSAAHGEPSKLPCSPEQAIAAWNRNAKQKAGSAEQVSEREAFEKFASAKGNGTWLAKNVDGSYKSIEIGTVWNYFQAGYSAALQSAPERKAMSDDVVQQFHDAVNHWYGEDLDFGEKLALLVDEHILAAQASVQSNPVARDSFTTAYHVNDAVEMVKKSPDAVQIIQELIDSHKRDTGECDDQCDIVDGMLAARDAVIAASEYQVVDANEMIKQSTDAGNVK